MARAPRPDPKTAVVDAAMRLAASRSWHSIALAEIAAEAGLGLIDVYRTLPSKTAILIAFARGIDAVVLATPSDQADPPRDRLFDVLMRRFEALAPYRPALKSIHLAALPLALRLHRSMGWMLEAAGIPASGFTGAARAKVLGAVYLATFRRFMGDEGEDLSVTMAALDQGLRRAEPFLRLPV